MNSTVFMGVAGCGKSTLAEAIAKSLDCLMIEGDQFHPAANVAKMHNGIPLTDDDRAQWLDILGLQLASHSDGIALTCSALKKAYRDKLRGYSPGLKLVFLEIGLDDALKRVEGRTHHFFPPSLVESQFATLESPSGEPGVLTVNATAPLPELVSQVLAYLSA